MTPKIRIYAKFALAFILWVFIYSVTRANTIFKIETLSLNQSTIGAIYVFITIWALLSFAYLNKLNNIYKGLFENPKTVYSFMDTLFMLMLLQDILYINLSFLNMSSQNISDPFFIIKIINFFALIGYFIKTYKKKLSKSQNIFKVFIAVLFLFLSANIELIIIDILIILYLICNHFLSNSPILQKLINIAVVSLILVTILLFSKGDNLIIFTINYIAITLYAVAKIVSKKRLDILAPTKYIGTSLPDDI